MKTHQMEPGPVPEVRAGLHPWESRLSVPLEVLLRNASPTRTEMGGEKKKNEPS